MIDGLVNWWHCPILWAKEKAAAESERKALFENGTAFVCLLACFLLWQTPGSSPSNNRWLVVRSKGAGPDQTRPIVFFLCCWMLQPKSAVPMNDTSDGKKSTRKNAFWVSADNQPPRLRIHSIRIRDKTMVWFFGSHRLISVFFLLRRNDSVVNIVSVVFVLFLFLQNRRTHRASELATFRSIRDLLIQCELFQWIELHTNHKAGWFASIADSRNMTPDMFWDTLAYTKVLLSLEENVMYEVHAYFSLPPHLLIGILAIVLFHRQHSVQIIFCVQTVFLC